MLVATGTWLSAKMNVEGDANALEGLAFLQRANSGEPLHVGSNVAIIGGGNTAIDAARTARRLGAREVTLIYRRSRAEMPAEPEEVADAVEEGVKIEFLAAPVNVGKGKITCVRMELGRKDESGRPAPTPIAESEFSLPCDTVITAIGQLSSAAELTLAVGKNGALTVDANFASSRPGVFAAGDVVTGPASIIQAIAQGKQAAATVDKYLGGIGIISEELVPDSPERQEPAPAGQMRTYVDTVDFGSRLNSFTWLKKAIRRMLLGAKPAVVWDAIRSRTRLRSIWRLARPVVIAAMRAAWGFSRNPLVSTNVAISQCRPPAVIAALDACVVSMPVQTLPSVCRK